MDKRRKIIIYTILSTIVSIVMILFSYYGITRYLSLHTQSSENFIKNYSKLEKAGKERVVISFTTTPDKIGKIKPMINSILDQTVKVDLIAIILLDDQDFDIPKYIKDVAGVVKAGIDYGKGTNLIPMLLREKDCDTIIIALNDNIVYGQDFIFTMIEESKQNPDTVIIDKKETAMLVKPEYFGCDVIDRNKETFDDNWFCKKAKNTKKIDYSENYKIIGF